MLEWKLHTQAEKVKEMRISNERCVYERTVLKHFNGYLPEWVPIWLSKTDEQLIQEGQCKLECKNCGKLADKWISTSFSFCDEYGCGIVLCEECAKLWAKTFKELFTL